MTIPIKFYILQSGSDANTPYSSVDANSRMADEPHHTKLIDFVCRLTQKVLKASGQRLVIVDDNKQRLSLLNDKLWEVTATSFIPHELFIALSHDERSVNNSVSVDTNSADASSADTTSTTLKDYLVEAITAQDLVAPVTLINELPDGFTGIVINLTDKPLALGNISQILEIVLPDPIGADKGRQKVHHYRGLNAKVDFFKVAI